MFNCLVLFWVCSKIIFDCFDDFRVIPYLFTVFLAPGDEEAGDEQAEDENAKMIRRTTSIVSASSRCSAT
jgi:hypothetical protein